MLELSNIIDQFKPREMRLIRLYYRQNDRREQKKLKLIELIIGKKMLSNKDAAKILYNKKPNSALSQLKKRLKEDLLQFLTLFSCDEHEDDPEIKCRNLILQADILLKKGLQTESMEALLRALKIAEKNELFIQSMSIREKFARTRYYKLEDIYYSALENSLSDLQNYFGAKIIAKNTFQFQSEAEQEEFNKKYFQLKELSESSKSVRIKIWFLLASLEYHKQRRNTVELNQTLSVLEPFLHSCPLSPVDMAAAFHKCALIHLFLNQLNKAQWCAEHCVDKIEKIRAFDLQAYETLFIIHFRNQNIDEARNALMLVERNIEVVNDKNIRSKWEYFRAGIEFKEGLYKESIRRLNGISFIQEQFDWIIGHRILEILNMIELNELLWLDYKLENFRKLLSRVKNRNIEIFKTIYQLLKYLWNNNFNFSLTLINENDKILKLSQHPIEPAGYELALVDDWLKKGVEKTQLLNRR